MIKVFKCIFLIFIVSVIFVSETYAYNEYKIGDEVKYNDIEFYVIKNSGSEDDSITLLKKEPIKSEQLNDYLSSTEIENKVDISDTYASMAYYSKETCVSSGDTSGCSTDYNVSDIKQVVDIWSNVYIGENNLKETRLLTLNDLTENLGYDIKNTSAGPGTDLLVTPDVPEFVYKYESLTSTEYYDKTYRVWGVYHYGLHGVDVSQNDCVIRPVIVLYKSAIGDNNDNKDTNQVIDNKNISETNIVNVPNTLQRISVIFIMIGVIIISVSTIVILKLRFRR